jgi:hypothetical protein
MGALPQTRRLGKTRPDVYAGTPCYRVQYHQALGIVWRDSGLGLSSPPESSVRSLLLHPASVQALDPMPDHAFGQDTRRKKPFRSRLPEIAHLDAAESSSSLPSSGKTLR